MSIETLAVKADPTSYTVNGGTSIPLSFQKDYSTVLVVPTADTDFRTRRTLKIDAKDPKINVGAPNGFTQQRVNLVYNRPKVLTNGKTTGNGFGLNFHWDVESTVAEKTADLDWLCQLALDPAFRAAVISGNMS